MESSEGCVGGVHMQEHMASPVGGVSRQHGRQEGRQEQV